jgi:hypothetical protein
VRRQDDDAIEFDVPSRYDRQIIHLQPKMPDFCFDAAGRANGSARSDCRPQRETNFGHYVAADAMNQPSCGSSAKFLVGA